MCALIKFSHKGDLKKTDRFLRRIKSRDFYQLLSSYGEKGVSLLSESTPRRTGATAGSWSYAVIMEDRTVGIEWYNSNLANDGRTPVAILIQMGHGTKNGGYVQPVDYINPCMQPLFDEITKAIDRAVKNL